MTLSLTRSQLDDLGLIEESEVKVTAVHVQVGECTDRQALVSSLLSLAIASTMLRDAAVHLANDLVNGTEE